MSPASAENNLVLGDHTRLMEHNPEIYWHTGDISHDHVSSLCRLKIGQERKISAKLHIGNTKTTKHLVSPFNHQSRTETSEVRRRFNWNPLRTNWPPGFTCPDPDEMDQGHQIFVWFLGIQPEGDWSNTVHSQKLAEALGNAHSTCFEDIATKMYQEFWDIFSQMSLLMILPAHKANGIHALISS